jgi:Fic family protein
VHASEYSDRSPGRLVSVSEGQVAFVPDPLPSDLHLDREAVCLLANAEFALGRLAGATAKLANPRLITAPLLHREAILSSRIDGTVTTPERLAMLEAGLADGDEVERENTRAVLNYIRVIEHGLRSPLPISVRLISELHAVLLEGVRGKHERADAAAAGQPPEGLDRPRVVRLPIQEMQACLDVFERRLQVATDKLPVLVSLALLHYQFEAIHPFRDGNGRIGRVMLVLTLARRGRLPQPVLCLAGYLERHRTEYFDALRAISQQSAWLPWVAFLLRGVEESANESLEHAESLLELWSHYRNLFHDKRTSGPLNQMIDALFVLPCTTIQHMADTLQLKRGDVSVSLQKLVAAGILVEVSGGTQDQIFLAPAILGFMRNRAESD